MPSDYSISLGAKGGTDRLLVNPGSERVQSMRGFEDTYVDIIDYIVRITHRIWEEKDIGYIYDTYKHNSRVVDGFGLQYGRDKIVADTVHTINAFPNIRLYADEIVWAGDDEVGFHTSHRTVIKGIIRASVAMDRLPAGASSFGASPTVLRWKMRFLRSGFCTTMPTWCGSWALICAEMAREIGNQRADDQVSVPSFEPERLPGQGKPAYLNYQPGQSLDVADFLQTTYHNVLNRRMLRRFTRSHAPNVRILSSNGRRFYGRHQYQAFLPLPLSCFPRSGFPD